VNVKTPQRLWSDMKFETLQSEVMYRGRAFEVRRDKVSLPNGCSTNLDIVGHAGAVTILPIDSEGQIWFVRQYRHPAGVEILELPAGTLEEGEDPATCARREIQEEIGMGAASLQKLGEFFLAPGYSTEYMYVFLALNLSPSSLPQDEDEFLSVERFPIDQVLEKAKKGGIQDAKTLAALFLAQPYLDALKS
jgi:ADP-ribose pyrophosphatase